MTLEINTLASVTERDIDLLVLEELLANPEFREWLSARVFGASIYQAEVGAWHSVTDSMLGETDIAFVFTTEAGERLAVLIENKISAPPQPQQAERYKQRGEKGIKEGFWEDFRSCAIAPDRYLASTGHSQKYDTAVSYEEILAFFSSRKFRDARFSHKAMLVQEAIEQNRRGYQPEYSEEMTDFVAGYHDAFASSYPHLGMQEANRRPAMGDWIAFIPEDYPEGIWLSHQMTAGVVKLFFDGKASEIQVIEERYKPYQSESMQIAAAGKSAAIAIKVPKLSPLEKSFSQEKENVQIAIDAIQELDKVARKVDVT